MVKGGRGGDGIVSFRREKFVPLGGPDGGDGGDGGAVSIRTEASVTTLRRFKSKRIYRAANGGGGRGKKKHGRKGEDLILSVPVGTVISNKTQMDSDALIADLDQDGEQVVVAKGGKGGFGNCHFTSSTNQAPQIAQKGEAGEEKSITLEMRLIADVGIVGYPNVGKSTLLAAASAANPEIAEYPFTTREPVLGVVEVDRQTFVLAEIPGLIDGAHLGRGLGHDFLRHIVRTKILIHLIDGTSLLPVDDMVRVNNELSLFDSALALKPQVVAVNKIDLPQVQARLAEIKEAFDSTGTTVFFVSAATQEGIPELIAETGRVLELTDRRRREDGEKIPKKVFHPQPHRVGADVHKEGDTFIVVAPELERVVAVSDVNSPAMRWQLKRRLIRSGVGRALRKAGIKPGDKVRCGNLEWEW